MPDLRIIEQVLNAKQSCAPRSDSSSPALPLLLLLLLPSCVRRCQPACMQTKDSRLAVPLAPISAAAGADAWVFCAGLCFWVPSACRYNSKLHSRTSPASSQWTVAHPWECRELVQAPEELTSSSFPALNNSGGSPIRTHAAPC